MNDPTPNRPPLWKLMADAYHSTVHDFDNVPHAYAAEIRAIADWLEAMWTAQGPPASIPMEFAEGLSIGMAIHREGTLNILRVEADRAEAGE